jgi:hypothetical protein
MEVRLIKATLGLGEQGQDKAWQEIRASFFCHVMHPQHYRLVALGIPSGIDV